MTQEFMKAIDISFMLMNFACFFYHSWVERYAYDKIN